MSGNGRRRVQTGVSEQRVAGAVLALGLTCVALHNWRLRQRDKELLRARGQPATIPPPASWPSLPTISVLVAAWNEAPNIDQFITSFLLLRYPNRELILCAGGVDGTYDIARTYESPQVTILAQAPGEGKQRALARSLAHTHGEIIFLTDADCLLADDPFERTVWPVAAGRDNVATGSSRPFDGQMRDPFVFAQAAIQTYGAMHAPPYAAGILGRNCAVRRDVLEKIGALDVPALTGTDYVLAKTLDGAGTAIRQVAESRIATEYPPTVTAYLRQQRRWLRNVALHGRRFGAQAEVAAVLRTSLTGLAMLLLPVLGAPASPLLLVAWIVLLGQALLARLRYLSFAGAVLNRRITLKDRVWQIPMLLLDFVAWIQPLADYVKHKGRWNW